MQQQAKDERTGTSCRVRSRALLCRRIENGRKKPKSCWAKPCYATFGSIQPGIMRTSPFKLITASSLMLGAVVVTWALLVSKPPITLTVLNYTTNRWSDELNAQAGSRTFVCAVIAVTNNSDQKFVYSARGGLARFVEYEILRQTPQGWKAPGGFRCGTGITRHELLPGQGFTFEAVVDSNTPCKVEFGFSNGRQPNQIWYRLPSWLTQRLPWFSPWRTVTTEPIDLRAPRT